MTTGARAMPHVPLGPGGLQTDQHACPGSSSRSCASLVVTIHCLDAATGARVWKHETNEAIWGSLLLAGDRLYVGNVEGSMSVLRAGRRKQLLGQSEMDAPLYSPPAPIGDALYLATANRLYLIASGVDPKTR